MPIRPAPYAAADPGVTASASVDDGFPADPRVHETVGTGDAGDVWGALRASLAELRENVGYLASAKFDAIKGGVRRVLLLLGLGVIALLAAVTLVVAAVVMLLRGIADALNIAIGNVWAGDMIVGGAVLIVLGLGLWISLRWVTGASRCATIKKYDSRKSQQRARFGRDVEGLTNVS